MGQTVISFLPANPAQAIKICEANRQSTWEFRRDGVQILQTILNESFLSKGVHAVLVGVYSNAGIKYAIFVEEGFLTPISFERDHDE